MHHKVHSVLIHSAMQIETTLTLPIFLLLPHHSLLHAGAAAWFSEPWLHVIMQFSSIYLYPWYHCFSMLLIVLWTGFDHIYWKCENVWRTSHPRLLNMARNFKACQKANWSFFKVIRVNEKEFNMKNDPRVQYGTWGTHGGGEKDYGPLVRGAM
jgi:hypothetical protein